MKDSKFARLCPPIPAWDTALTDTEGRPSVDPLTWLASTEDIVAALPEILATNPGFRNCKQYHVYFVVPDEASHPLYDRVN